MRHTFTFHSDPNHGWLAVDIVQVNNCVEGGTHAFSKYSYRSESGHTLFLEAGRDAPLFLRAYKALHGSAPLIQDRYTDGESFIRSLKRI